MIYWMVVSPLNRDDIRSDLAAASKVSKEKLQFCQPYRCLPVLSSRSVTHTTNVNHADISNNTAMTRLNRLIATADRQNLAAPRPR